MALLGARDEVLDVVLLRALERLRVDVPLLLRRRAGSAAPHWILRRTDQWRGLPRLASGGAITSPWEKTESDSSASDEPCDVIGCVWGR